MVSVRLMGGLGNQMFQFAAGKALSKRLDSDLHLDPSWFAEIRGKRKVVQRHYELGGFGIAPSASELYSQSKEPFTVFREKGFYYHQDFERLEGNVRIEGYWQSHKYFADCRDEILGSFSFPPLTCRANRELLGQIRSEASVLVHIRRGDYNTRRGRRFHGLLPLDYYGKALAALRANIRRPHLFVFSDELEWCKASLNTDLPTTFIDSNSANSGVDDLHLMSACKHFVIANSSFSWWAAWLSQDPRKRIYAPKKWLAKGSVEDLIPNLWTVL